MAVRQRPVFFPPPEMAHSSGLLCVGGELTPAWLIDAYRHGIFPWPAFPDVDVLAWWSPDPRAIIEMEKLHVSRRLERKIRSGKFQLTINRAFDDVIRECATVRDRNGATWITPEILAAYSRFHRIGYAHSVEAWHKDRLAGGIYGVAMGGLFAAESMFYHVPDASKVALVFLAEHLRNQRFSLFDIQQLTPHTARLGAEEIPRADYLIRLQDAVEKNVTFTL